MLTDMFQCCFTPGDQDCARHSEVTLKDMDKIDRIKT